LYVWNFGKEGRVMGIMYPFGDVGFPCYRIIRYLVLMYCGLDNWKRKKIENLRGEDEDEDVKDTNRKNLK
jgi:hypothetical protein